MYLSQKWLKDFIDIPKSLSAAELGQKLTMHTVEIDGVQSQADRFDKVVIGRILEISKHPQADKLQIAIVDVKTEKLRIVCGAPNIAVGQLVPVALCGAKLPNGLEIKPVAIRGEESNGMLCAEDELGLGDDHSGIMILSADAKIGAPFSEQLGFDDNIFEVDNKSITNRPDLWGHFGMAREIAAFLELDWSDKSASYSLENLRSDKEECEIKVKVEDRKACPRYMAIAMDNIRVEESPKWLQNRLIAVGIRPISNIVDITNYVMLEYGQPLHAFDLDKVSDGKRDKANIIVRAASKGEQIECLDGVNRECRGGELLITRPTGPLAVAGIIGGASSAIGSESTAIVFEAANFGSSTIRQGSQSLQLRTEASQRFEKSLDPRSCEIALCRAAELVKKICPDSRIISKATDEGGFSFKAPSLELSLAWLKRFLGADIADKKVLAILERLGFSPLQDGDQLKVSVPSWRATKDISIREDIAEEVARIYGYDNITPLMPAIPMAVQADDKEMLLCRRIADILSGAPAMSEVSNYSFVGEEQLKTLGVDFSKHIRLRNPISQNHTMLRQSLAANLIDNVKRNQSRYELIKLFEIGSVYLPVDGPLAMGDGRRSLPLQEKTLGLVVAKDDDSAYDELKSIIAYLFSELGLATAAFSFREKMLYWADERYSGEVVAGEQPFGLINMLAAASARKAGLKKHIAIAEINLGRLGLGWEPGKKRYRAQEKFPPLMRDLAFVVDERLAYSDLHREIASFHPLISSVLLFDQYQGERLGKDKKSLAFHIEFQADRTLESAEVDEIQAKLLVELDKKFGAKLRDF